MNKKGMEFEPVIVVVLVIVAFVVIFIAFKSIYKYGKEEVAPSAACRTSVIMASQKIGLAKSGELPRLDCPKIEVEIEADKMEEIKKELLDYAIKASQDFSTRQLFSKIEGTYCKRRYSITFKHKELGEIKDFNKYARENFPKGSLLGLSVPVGSIDLSKEYLVMFFAVIEGDLGTWGKDKFASIVSLEVRYGSKNMGIALFEGDKILDLGCTHLV